MPKEGATFIQQPSAFHLYPATSSSCRPLRNTLSFLLVGALVVAVAVRGTTAAAIDTSSVQEAAVGDTESQTLDQKDVQSTELEVSLQEEDEEDTLQREARRARGRGHANQDREPDDCESEMSNDTIPAAHIDGRQFRWDQNTTSRFGSRMKTYVTKWTCETNNNNNNAYVAGGMVFNQTEKALYVPKCGYYYISSQINFYFDPNDQLGKHPRDFRALHHLNVDRNCSGQDTREYLTVGYSPLGDGTFPSESATSVSDMVKMCAGGKIWITIPSTVPCCPRGTTGGTFLSAYLVHETDCQWPINSSR